ncbi:MAG: hypothetical protein A3F13_01830 [Gammaproteobacteria bacterium RIFCSPHIGHO2_12_FULL_40_19]|nr:MAG: hypothetical protein A3F13_01830 [Gammaproteobacteria bacterium RIFCSPHIGHO2_12_FULL_40_19]
MRLLKWLGLLLGVISLSSCFSPIKTTPLSTYTLTDFSKNDVASQPAVSHQTIFVTTPVASPGYASSKMIYVMIPYQLKSFATNRWVAPPAELLLPLIANRLRAAGYFHAVVTSPFTGAAHYQLNTHLLKLQQEFIQPQSQVRLTIEATLMNVATGRVIANNLFETTVPATANNPYAGVLATNQAAHTLSKQIAAFVVQSVAGRKSQ